MRALQIHCASREASIKHLKDRLESKANALKKFKESSWTLGQEMIDLKAKLNGTTHQTDKLMKDNANLKSKVVALHEQTNKAKEEAIDEYQVSQPYFNEMGDYYRDGFKDFRKQAILMFLDLDFFQIQIKLREAMNWATKPIPDDVEIDDEVLVTDTPGNVANDPKDP